jgi:hypothetical protein
MWMIERENQWPKKGVTPEGKFLGLEWGNKIKRAEGGMWHLKCTKSQTFQWIFFQNWNM